MSSCLTSDSSSAVPITPVTKDSLPQWLERHPGRREWLNLIGFKAEPNSFAFLPPSDGDRTRVLAGVGEGESIWAFAGLPTSLPEGVYAIDTALDDAQATAAALGWSLGTYAFTRYKSAKRAPASLVWPTRSDHAEVDRITKGVFLARDLINTPTEDMGPDQLIDAGAAIARDAGASDPAHRPISGHARPRPRARRRRRL